MFREIEILPTVLDRDMDLPLDRLRLLSTIPLLSVHPSLPTWVSCALISCPYAALTTIEM